MKRIIKLTIILAYSLAGWAQCDNTQPSLDNVCEKGKGIRTNPNNLQNPVCPDLINKFDWPTTKTIML